LIELDLAAQLEGHQHKDRLRFVACGSVDDGKSTLLGRLLYESQQVFDDQIAALERDSRNGEIDLSLLLDGLAAEREQGITIDVAYRYFTTERRTFIVADAPGHEQYTRNMITAASTADAAVVLIDARQGMTTQTRRHTRLLGLLGVKYVAVAINKLDLVDYDRAVFERISDEFYDLAAPLEFTGVTVIPVSALRGDNVVERSGQTPYYDGPTLMEWLHDVPPRSLSTNAPFRMPVSYVIRPDSEFRGVAGQIVDGTVRVGDEVVVSPSGAKTRIQRIVTFDGDLEAAGPERSVTLVFEDEVDASRGDVVCAADRPADVCDQLEVELVWMDERELVPGRTYQVRLATRSTGARLSEPTCAIAPDTGERTPAATLQVNEIGIVNLALDRPVAFDLYRQSRDMGGCIIIDRMTRRTVAAGMVTRGLRRATNIQWQGLEVDKHAHTALNGHRPRALWMTGLSGAGKTTIADLVAQQLHVEGVHTSVLDGDNVRHGLSRDLGFSDEDRDENVRRVAEVAKLMVHSGLVVIVAFISPFRAQREAARRLFEPDEFIEVFVDAPLGVAEARDPKGLYRKARAGEVSGFTGVDSAYEPPEHPEIHIDTTSMSPEAAAQAIIDHLRATGLWEI